jgi:hypothetical protein
MKKRLTALFILAFFNINFCLASNDLPKQGDLISGSYQVHIDGLAEKGLLRSIPLPAGEWIIVSAWDRPSVNNALAGNRIQPVSLREIVLAQVNKSNQLVAAIFFTTNLESHAYRWDPNYCNDVNDNFIYSNQYGTDLWQQRCTNIMVTGYLQSSTPGQNKVREFYNSKGIKFDSNALRVQTSEYDHRGNILRFDLFYFPSTYGLENPSVGNPTMSPWFKTNYKQDPKKVKFIEGLQKWADEYSNLQNKYFSGSDKLVDKIDLYKFSN